MFISPAYAADAAVAGEPGLLTSFLPLLVVFAIFYFLIIRPQNKRMAEHRRMINNLKRGDKVVTGGGLVATVKKLLNDDEVQLELSDGMTVTAVRSTLMANRSPKPANDATPPAKVKKEPKAKAKPKAKK